MSEHENAPAAPPEGEAEAILRRKEVRQPCSGKRGDGPWVLVEPAIYLSVTERDTVLAALAAATARADRAERLYQEAKAIVAQSELAERLAQAEAEELRVRLAALTARDHAYNSSEGLKPSATQRRWVPESVGVAVMCLSDEAVRYGASLEIGDGSGHEAGDFLRAATRDLYDTLEREFADREARVEAMREAAAMTRPPRAAGNPPNGRWGGEYQCGWDDAVIAMDAAIRALPATPAPEVGSRENPVRVVAGVRHIGNRWWVCRRAADGAHAGQAGMWEFPGGKVEEGESLTDALRREMLEEFEVPPFIGEELACITTMAPGSDWWYEVHFFHMEFPWEPVKLNDHSQTCWCTPGTLLQQEHLPSGMEFIRRIVATPAPGPSAEDAR